MVVVWPANGLMGPLNTVSWVQCVDAVSNGPCLLGVVCTVPFLLLAVSNVPY